MGLRDTVALDFQTNMNAEVGDNITLTEPEEDPITVKGWVKRIDKYINGEGVEIFEPATRITISLKDLATEPDNGWEVSTTDIQGNTISGIVSNIEFDRTIGYCFFIIEAAA